MDTRASRLASALHNSAARHFGVKLVGPLSRSWFDSEIAFLFKIKKLARDTLDAAIVCDSPCVAEAMQLLKPKLWSKDSLALSGKPKNVALFGISTMRLAALNSFGPAGNQGHENSSPRKLLPLLWISTAKH